MEFSPLCNTFFFRNTWRSVRNLRLVGYQSGFSILGTSQLFCYFSRSIMVHADIDEADQVYLDVLSMHDLVGWP